MASKYTVVSWNVNGYKPDIHDWLKEFIKVNNPSVLFLTETKKTVEELHPYLSQFTDYNVIYNVHKPKHWHGVVMLINKKHTYEQFQINMGIPPRADCKDVSPTCGRIISISLDKKFYLVGTYTPNSGHGAPLKYLNYRIQWDKAFHEVLNFIRTNGAVVWIGDINVAATDLDVSNQKIMAKWAGFTPEERKSFNEFLSGQWIDIWRKQHPGVKLYSWRGSSRSPNYGMRLDNIIISKDLEPYTTNSFMITDCECSSDHIPLGIQLQL